MSQATKSTRGSKKKMVMIADGASMFNEEELKDIEKIKIGLDHVQVACACTRRLYGDYVGLLRVFPDGRLQIDCQCHDGCEKAKLGPDEFIKHCDIQETESWPSRIWVTVDGVKTKIRNTPLLNYYKDIVPSTSEGNANSSGCLKRPRHKFHRDEFITCARCGFIRRFHLHTKEECRIYHDTVAKRRNLCSSMGFKCLEETERLIRKNVRGCPRDGKCEGCTSCVCFGCHLCRFSDCFCRTCLDFYSNENSLFLGPPILGPPECKKSKNN